MRATVQFIGGPLDGQSQTRTKGAVVENPDNEVLDTLGKLVRFDREQLVGKDGCAMQAVYAIARVDLSPKARIIELRFIGYERVVSDVDATLPRFKLP